LKPAAFSYHRPESVESALALLARHGGEARVLAGGQSLAPLLNMRLAQTEHLIDINDLDELGLIRDKGTHLEIGALARHREIEQSPLVRRRCPLLARCAGTIGHYAIRSRGSIGGSLAQADPAAQFVLASLLLDAQMLLLRHSGSRRVSAQEFITGPMQTCLAPDELLASVIVPAQPDGEHSAYQAFSRRHGDYAIVAVGLTLRLAQACIARIRIALSGAAETVVRLQELEERLTGQTLDSRLPERIARLCADSVSPVEGEGASADYRRALVGTLVERAVREAIQANTEGGQ
jgi:carbon-monoxide dehydrogenase medium subunit